MAKSYQKIVSRELKSIREANQTVERLIESAAPTSAYAEPIEIGDYTIITAAETSCLLGVGYGVGGGGSPPSEDELDAPAGEGVGGGGGGGGFSTARPVAAIAIGPEGVYIHPVQDRTKVLLALATALGSMAISFGRMRRRSRG